jgi:hypothetical protein
VRKRAWRGAHRACGTSSGKDVREREVASMAIQIIGGLGRGDKYVLVHRVLSPSETGSGAKSFFTVVSCVTFSWHTERDSSNVHQNIGLLKSTYTNPNQKPRDALGKWVTMLRDISRCRSCCDESRRTRASELYHRYKRPVSSYHTLDGRPRGPLCSPNDLYARFGLVVWVWHSLGRTFVVHKRPLCSFVVCLAQYSAYPHVQCGPVVTLL